MPAADRPIRNNKLTIFPVAKIPLVKAGDDLVKLIGAALIHAGLELGDGDVLVIAQKIVSKSEDRSVLLSEVQPSARAGELAAQTDKDPRLVELILQESTQIVRTAPGVIIVQHRLGIVCANAGIDQSNIEHRDGERALLLPEDPDRSAHNLRTAFLSASGKQIGVIISDSINRPWRLGTIGIAIGSAGITVLDDRRGDRDLFGRELQVTMSNRADSIASAALLSMGETSERVPVVLLRGLPFESSGQTAGDAIRPRTEDLFL
jgi:coenzyme F420-0:L-glutamate ligase/coenzyme F420-1:gamma-L-glutamate ligase